MWKCDAPGVDFHFYLDLDAPVRKMIAHINDVNKNAHSALEVKSLLFIVLLYSCWYFAGTKAMFFRVIA